MSTETTTERGREIYESLASRCAELQIPLWHCDATGKMIIEPQSPVDLPREQIQLVINCICHATNREPMQVAPDKWLTPIEHRQGNRLLALNIAMIDSAELEQVRRIGKLLQISIAELSRSDHDGRTIEQFSEKLAQAYEESNLLYRMARMLNYAGDPAQSVEEIAMQLQEVLPFQWLAIRFSDQSREVRDLAGKTILAGTPPCDIEQIKLLSDPLMNRPIGDKWVKLLNPKSDPLAAATEAEVLAEPITHDDRLIGILLAGNKSGPEPELSSFEIQFLDATADVLGVFHENLARFAEQQDMFLGTLGSLTAAIDAKDRYTSGHSERVGLMASKMAEAMGLDRRFVEQYRIAGLVHDVGKIGVPEGVLCKPGRLTDEEFNQIKLHPEIGYKILKDIPSLAAVLPGVLSHHERWDGRGYPNKLAGENIPLIARVLALADTFDAMSSNRSYRPALPREKVLEEIRKNGGTQFDPSLAPIFVGLDFSDFDRALESHRNLSQQAA